MKLTVTTGLLFALLSSAVAQIGPKPSSCRSSFGVMYTDKLGNKYESVQGKELKEVQRRLTKKLQGVVCMIDEGEPDYIFDVHGYQKVRLVEGTEVPYTEYILEIHRGAKPYPLVHTFDRSNRFDRHSESSSPIIDLVEDGAAWLRLYPNG